MSRPRPKRGVDLGLKRRQRLLSPLAFQKLFESDGIPGRFLVLWHGGSGADKSAGPSASRLGVVASKRTFPHAVDRNRARRRLREAFRLNRSRMDGPADVVLLARRRILRASFPELERDLLSAFRKAGMLGGTPSPGARA